jgi:diguanylate cyclase (GGDEF)-like protein/PAS domain S-box-containing protein
MSASFPLADDNVFQGLSEAALDAIVAFDSDGTIQSWNTAAARMFGYLAGEALGQPATMLVSDPQADSQQARILRVLDGEHIHRVSADGKRKDGTVVPMTMTIVPFGRASGVIIARDLTEERLAQTTLTEAELRLNEAQELSHVGLWLWDSTTDALQISDELYRIHGLTPFEFEGTMAAYLGRVHADDRETFSAALTCSLRTGQGLEEEYRIERPGGSIGWVFSRAEIVSGPGGRGLRGVAQDVTDRKRAAESLREQAALVELLRRMAVAANEAAGLEQALRTCVRDICLHTGWAVGRVVFMEGDRVGASGMAHTMNAERYGEVVAACETPMRVTPAWINRLLRTRKPVVASIGGLGSDELGAAAEAAGLDTTIAIPLLVGSEVATVLQFFAAGQPDPGLVTTVWNGANQLGRVVERARSRDELSHQALHDALTGLPNRSLLMNRVGQALIRQARFGGPVALIVLDLDNFKLVNDSLGHEAGDELVVTISRRLERVLRPEDTVARLGGDEFIVLAGHLENEEAAVDLAERMLTTVAEPIPLRGQRGTVLTASAGIAIAAVPGTSAEALLRNADLAMYRAKEVGHGRYEIFESEMHRRATERLTVANELRSAIGRNQLRLSYQPQVDTSTGQLVGVEALVRWQHPERGLLSPAEFVPIAEETHLIVPLGGWVLLEACRQGAEWSARYPDRPLKLSVNVSPKQLSRPQLIDDVADALSRTGMPAANLCIEMTESILMGDADFFLEALLGLKLLGVTIAIDDFGTGYSSLAYLRRYPIDVLKIDKGFVDGLDEDDPRSAAVMAAVVGLAHALGVVALAEGVETESQLALLRQLGCDQCQGDLFARAVGSDVITALLESDGRIDPEERGR